MISFFCHGKSFWMHFWNLKRNFFFCKSKKKTSKDGHSRNLHVIIFLALFFPQTPLQIVKKFLSFLFVCLTEFSSFSYLCLYDVVSFLVFSCLCLFFHYFFSSRLSVCMFICFFFLSFFISLFSLSFQSHTACVL